MGQCFTGGHCATAGEKPRDFFRRGRRQPRVFDLPEGFGWRSLTILCPFNFPHRVLLCLAHSLLNRNEPAALDGCPLAGGPIAHCSALRGASGGRAKVSALGLAWLLWRWRSAEILPHALEFPAIFQFSVVGQ